MPDARFKISENTSPQTLGSSNIARHLPLMAARQPQVPALKIPRGRTATGDIDYLTLTFAELDAETDAWVARLTTAGVRPDDRVLFMVKQGLPLIALAFALFKLGAIPILIDPGMGLKNFLACVARSRPRVLLGIPLARFLSHLCRRAFATVELRLAVSSSPTARCPNPSPITYNPSPRDRAQRDLAAILFTSGSTGAPKGVCYEHGQFAAQVEAIRATYSIQPGEIDLPMLPIFALFNPALGMTTIVPEIDPRRPAAVDPTKIVQAILQEKITNSFGSPTLWLKVARYCNEKQLQLPTLRRVLSAGAPVPAALWQLSENLLPNGQLHSPYGATESLPVSTISSREIAALLSSGTPDSRPADSTFDPRPSDLRPAAAPPLPGTPIGVPLPHITVKIIAPHDDPLASLADTRELPTGEIGELIVRGPVVTRAYDALPAATADAKIPDGPDVWHRLGDCAYLDASGLLWFCGRKAERVLTASGPLDTEPLERHFRSQPHVERCALIGIQRNNTTFPALVIQPVPGAPPPAAHAAALRAHAKTHPAASVIDTFYFHKNFPVDVRHNTKIHRLTLTRWATTAKPHRPA